jgi:hypothetical protein
MAGLGRDIFDAFVDNRADRFVNDFIPGNGMFLFLELITNFLIYLGAFQTGVDQWLNNDINRHLGGGLGSTYGYDYGGGFNGGFGGGYGGYGGW